MRYSAPLVVVPNPTLMNNHQAELAEECEKQRWAVHGKLGWVFYQRRIACWQSSYRVLTRARHIVEAVKRIVELTAEGPLASLPPYAPPPFPVPESERITLFDWMALTCYPEEFKRQQHILELRSTNTASQEMGTSSGPQTSREEQTRMGLD
jgi:beta-1,4-N-acetylglucosaminyltransferase